MRYLFSFPLITAAALALTLHSPAVAQGSRFAHAAPVRAVAFSKDGKHLATSCQGDTAIHVWDLASGKESGTFPGVPGGALFLIFSPDGKALAAGGRDGIVYLFDAAAGKPILQLKGHEKEVTCAAFAGDGKTLASAGLDRTVRLWDPATGKELNQFKELDAINALAFSPDSKQLAVVGWFKEVHLWDVAAAKVIRAFNGHQAECVSVAFSPDGRLLASGSLEQAIRLWEVFSGEEVRKIDDPKEQANSLAFSPDGRLLLAAFGDRTVRLLDVPRNREAFRSDEHQGPVFAATFSADGKFVASGGSDAKAIVTDITPVYRDLQAPAEAIPPRKLESYWARLAGRNSHSGFQAVWALGSAPRQAMPLFQERLTPFADLMEGKRVGQLISDLNDDRFAVREKASKDLEKMGGLVEPILRKSLMGKLPSLEVRRRIERILEKFKAERGGGPSPEVLRAMRSITVLEMIGTPEAKQLLEKFARGMPDAQLTLDAKTALERLGKRVAVP